MTSKYRCISLITMPYGVNGNKYALIALDASDTVAPSWQQFDFPALYFPTLKSAQYAADSLSDWSCRDIVLGAKRGSLVSDAIVASIHSNSAVDYVNCKSGRWHYAVSSGTEKAGA